MSCQAPRVVHEVQGTEPENSTLQTLNTSDETPNPKIPCSRITVDNMYHPSPSALLTSELSDSTPLRSPRPFKLCSPTSNPICKASRKEIVCLLRLCSTDFRD